MKLIIALTVLFISIVFAEPRIECSGTAVRKEIRQCLKDGDFPSFVNAYNAMAANGRLKWYNDLHSKLFSRMHGTPRFLPFHRIFLKEFEKELISHNAKYLPYYDSSIDSQLPIGASAIFTSELLGSHDPATGEVIDGMFAHWNKPEGGPLKRGFNLKGKPFYFASPIKNQKQMEEIKSFSEWSSTMDGTAHAPMHYRIKGDMASQYTALDPLFYVHHAFIDKLWATYSAMHPDIEFEGNAYSNSKKEKNLDKLNLESLIEPWGIPIKNTLNLREHSCVRYEEVSASIIQEASAKVQDKVVVNDVVIDDQASKSWFKKLGVDESLQEKVIQESKIIDKEVKEEVKSGKKVESVKIKITEEEKVAIANEKEATPEGNPIDIVFVAPKTTTVQRSPNSVVAPKTTTVQRSPNSVVAPKTTTVQPNCPLPRKVDCLASQSQFTVLGTIISSYQDLNPNDYNATMKIQCVYSSFSDPVSSLLNNYDTVVVKNWGVNRPECSGVNGDQGSNAVINATRIYYLYIDEQPVLNTAPVLYVFDVCSGGGSDATESNLEIIYSVITQSPSKKLLVGSNCTLPTQTGSVSLFHTQTASPTSEPTGTISDGQRTFPTRAIILLAIIVILFFEV